MSQVKSITLYIYIYIYILRPHTRMTGNFVASSRSPRFPKTRLLLESLNKVGRQARESVPLLHEIYTSYKMRNLIGNRDS